MASYKTVNFQLYRKFIARDELVPIIAKLYGFNMNLSHYRARARTDLYAYATTCINVHTYRARRHAHRYIFICPSINICFLNAYLPII
jgi:hypothetical protein